MRKHASTRNDAVMAADQIVEEVLGLMDSGALPLDVESFSELHDHCDANCLGPFVIEESNVEWDMDHINLAQTIVDKWLGARAGHL